MSEVYLPGEGFHADDDLGLAGRAVVEQDGRAIAVLRLVSGPDGTRVWFEIRDPEIESRCWSGGLGHREIQSAVVELHDAAGDAYERTPVPNMMGLGQHEFGFVARHIGFSRLPADTRRVMLDLRGELGEWNVPIDVVPLHEIGLARKHVVDASTTREGITLHVTGIALLPTVTVVEFDVPSAPDGPRLRAVGSELQRQREDRLVLRDGDGRTYLEEPSRETVQHPPEDAKGLQYALFAPLPSEVRHVTIVANAMIVEESDATADVALPVTTPGEFALGRHLLRIESAVFAGDLPSPPGKPPEYGLRLVVGPAKAATVANAAAATNAAGREAIRPARLVIDGKTHHCGFGWHPDPALTNIEVTLAREEEPSSMTMQGAIVRVAGPWEVAFELPS